MKLVVGITAESSVNLLRGQLNFFKEMGYETYLLAPYSERVRDFCEEEGCSHLQIKIKRDISLLSDLRTLFEIISIFRRVSPDVINLGTPKVSLLGMVAGRIVGVKRRIYTCRGFRFEHEQGIKKDVLALTERITSSLAHQIIAISPSVRQLGMDLSIFTKKKCVVINKGSSNGLDLTLFNKEKLSRETLVDLKKSLGLSDKIFIFGFVGRLVDRKGIRELYIAFSELYSQDSQIRLLIVGPFEASQIRDESIIDDLQEHPGIIVTGRKQQEEIPLFLSLMDTFILPAWWEGFGNVIIQASALGVPVISTYGTGTKDAVSENYSGLLVPVKDADKLRSAMLKMRTDSSLRRSLGKNGLLWAKNFKREVIWQELDKLYKAY